MLTVCTGWSPSGWVEYGQRFLETFNRFWPQDVRLLAYTEVPVYLPRGECRSIWDITGCQDFIERHRNNRAARGKQPGPDWKRSSLEAGYNWRFDAWKFCRQAFIPAAAAAEVKDGLLCWLDADVVTFDQVPSGFIESLLPKDKDLAFLGRGSFHSEIGFQLYRVPPANNMLAHFRDYYASDDVFKLDEWHSAYVFDRARIESGIKAHDLTPGGTGHVWFQSRLGKYLDHLKGKRKAVGRSVERV